MSKNFKDKRKLPLQLNYQLDELKMSDAAFRVYVHLVRRAGRDDSCFPSYRAIGDHCWPSLSKSRRRNKAIEAIAELQKFNLIGIEQRIDHWGYHSNIYYLQDDWESSSCGEPPLVRTADHPSSCGEPPLVCQANHPGSSGEPLKITNVKLTKFEVNQSEVSFEADEKKRDFAQVEILEEPEVQENLSEENQDNSSSLAKILNPGEDQCSAPPRVDEKYNNNEIGSGYSNPEWCRQRLRNVGARNGTEWDEGFLSVIQKHLNKTDFYRGNKATLHNARTYCERKWKSEPGCLLDFAEKAIANPMGSNGLTAEQERAIDEALGLI